MEEQVKKEEEKKDQAEKKCIVYYKTGFLDGIFFGERFDSLCPCCPTFEEIFLHTGNEKNPVWGQKNTIFDEIKSGLGFVKVNGELVVTFCGKPIKFCPWSGHAVEVRKFREVKVQRKLKIVPDGYREVDLEGWDQ